MALLLDQLARRARRRRGAAALTLLLGLGAPASASAAEADLTGSCDRYASDGVRVAECVEELRIARDASAKYRDSAVALRDGFVPSGCHEHPGAGAMGEHWNRVDRMADQTFDPREPEELLYIDTPSGRRLLAVEWSVPALEGGLPHYGTEPPDPSRTPPPPRMFGGRSFNGPMQGHNLVEAWPSDLHLTPQPWHYDLHVWLWEENPDGIFAQYNQRVSCTDGVAPEGDGGGGEAGTPSDARPREARLWLLVLPNRTRAGRRTRFRFHVTTGGQGARRAVAGAVVRLADRKAATDRRGRAVIVTELRRTGRHHVRAVKRGMRNGRASVRVMP